MSQLSLVIPGAGGNPITINPPAKIPSGGVGFTLDNIMGVGLSLLIISAILLSLLYLIWGGISWITSEGDKQKLAQARQKIVFAIIGLIVVFLAFSIINAISGFFLGFSGGGGGGGGAKLY